MTKTLKNIKSREAGMSVDFKIARCANCDKEINLDTDAQTACSGCKENFCFSMSSPCFSEYHRRNNLRSGHAALSITNPAWTIKLRCSDGDQK